MNTRTGFAMKRGWRVVLCFLTGLLSLPLASAAPQSKPNIIVILADDLGWTDLSCYGSDWYYQHYQLGGTTPYGAIRAGDFKLIEFFDDMCVELYNLREDIGEQRNLASQMAAKADELRARLRAWRKEVGAQMPSRNPNYDPSKPEHDPAARKKREVGK